MNNTITQTIALDSCVVIDLIEKPALGSKLKTLLKGKSIRIAVCDVVVSEVGKKRGYTPEKICQTISNRLGRKVELDHLEDDERTFAKQTSSIYHGCHHGDNFILAFCKLRDFILLTFDRMLLKICDFVGVVAFHPLQAGGI